VVVTVMVVSVERDSQFTDHLFHVMFLVKRHCAENILLACLFSVKAPTVNYV